MNKRIFFGSSAFSYCRRGVNGVVLALCVSLLLLTACDQVPPVASHFNATELKTADFGKDFSLQDSEQRTRTLADWRGKVVMVFFGYTQCPDVCPTALSRAARVMKLLGKSAEQVQVIFITLDPERDNLSLLREYVQQFNPGFIGLRGTPEQTQQLAKDFKVYYSKVPGKRPGSYSVDHSALSYIYNKEGRLRLLVNYDTPAEAVAADIKELLATM